MNLRKLLPEFQDPDEVGQSEYRAIYDCCQDALDSAIEGDNPAEDIDLMLSVLGEFRDIAAQLTKDIQARLDKEAATDATDLQVPKL